MHSNKKEIQILLGLLQRQQPCFKNGVNMDFDKTIGGYLENTEWKGRTDIGCLLNGCRQMYAATQDERYQKFILQYVEKMSEEWENAFSKTDVTKKINAGSAWIFAYEKTSEEKYKEYIERMKDNLMGLSRTAEGSLCEEGDHKKLMTGQHLYEVLPFYMEYETRYHNKAGYNDIVNQLTEMRSGKDAIWYVMALIDVLDHMSIEIFEHYKSLQEIFKKTIKCIPLGGDAKMQKVCMGYAILKACNIGILNPEKYLETGRTLIDGAIDEPFDQKDDVSMGIMMMAYAQFIRVM